MSRIKTKKLYDDEALHHPDDEELVKDIQRAIQVALPTRRKPLRSLLEIVSMASFAELAYGGLSENGFVMTMKDGSVFEVNISMIRAHEYESTNEME